MTNGILLTRHNQEITQWSPDPFPRERVGSGHETTFRIDPRGNEMSIYEKKGGESCVHVHKHMYTRGCGGTIPQKILDFRLPETASDALSRTLY